MSPGLPAALTAALVAGFALWWYFRPFAWLGLGLAAASGVFTYALLTARRQERLRRFFFIGLFGVILVSFLVIIEIWNTDFILSWAPQHLDWMEYYISGGPPGAVSFPCNRMVSQVFFGRAVYFTGFWTWQAPFPGSPGQLLLALSPFLVTGLVFGRGFCGWVCPFGGLTEAMIAAGKQRRRPGFLMNRTAKRPGFDILKGWVKDVKFAVLTAVILLSVFLAFPVVCVLCPALWLSFMPIFWTVLGLSAVFAVALPLVTGRRWWCFICPIAAVVSLLDRISFIHIKANREKCLECDKCAAACNMYALNAGSASRTEAPDGDCVRCFRCIEACPAGVMDMYWRGTRLKARGAFVALAVIAALAWYKWFLVILVDRLASLF